MPDSIVKNGLQQALPKMRGSLPGSLSNHGRIAVTLKLTCWLLFLGAARVELFPQEATNEWVLNIGSPSDACPAISPDGTIYVGTFLGRLWAVNPNGTKKWVFRAGREIKSSPAVGSDGTIYFGSRDRKFYAVGPDGKLKWTFNTGAWVDSSPALAQDGMVYFGSWDKNFYALNPDGGKLWQFATSGPVVSSPAIGEDGTVYFGSHDAILYALTPEGRKLWEFKTGGPIISSPALDWEGRIYFTSVDGFLYVLNGDGSLRWKLQAASIREGSPVVGLDGLVLIAANDEMWAVTPEGQKKWARGKDAMDSTAAVAADGSVIFVYRGGQVANCDHDINLRWTHFVYPVGCGSPAIGASGTIYLPGRWFGLVAIQSASPLAGTPWPKFRGNARNTGNLSDSPH
jgi:outer membrane protein assembly factor BamB